MKKKINFWYVMVTFIAIAFTMITAATVFYGLYKKEVLDNLKCSARIIGESGTFAGIRDEEVQFYPEVDGMRVTVIDEDGSVLYDSIQDANTLENHRNRPEIKDALDNGEGSSVRKSDTMQKNNFYYAVKIDDNTVLRLSRETASIWNIFYNAMPVISALAVLLFILCICLTKILTISIIKPIEQMANDLDHIDNISTYSELMPFINLIKKQHDDILKSAKMRQEFTANVSHELKTPLTSISGYSELIENGMAAQGDIIRFAGEIHDNSKRLLALINDILKLSELDSADTELFKESVDLYKISLNCANMLELHARNHGVTISCEGSECVVSANTDMMEEVLYNLCDNAIRYNKTGGNVWIKVYANAAGNGVITVEDDGIGISEENQKRIFERFYRVDKSRSKKTGGTGLGLAIVKHIVEKHNASIEIESEEGRGTKITIKMP